MRRLAPILLSLLLVASSSALATRAEAATASASLTLLAQSPWNGPTRPLVLKVRAENSSSEPLTDLSLSLTVFGPPIGRIEYDQSMKNDVTSLTGVSGAFVEPGVIPVGGVRTFTLRLPVATLEALGGSNLYPIRVDLRSGASLEVLATLRTPMIFLTQTPAATMDLCWTWALSEPLQLGPDGVFQAGPIERDISPAGRLSQQVQALLRARRPADVAVSSVLLQELELMSQGYRVRRGSTVVTVPKGSGGAADAEALLASLRELAAESRIDLSPSPFADPSVPALVNGGLGADVRTLLQRGRDEARRILQSGMSDTVLRPPGSQVDQASIARLARSGISVLLIDPGLVPQPPGTTPTPLPVARMTVGSRPVTLVLPDTRLAAVLAASRQSGQEVLDAHVALGELATAYFEAPAAEGRGMAMVFPEKPPEQPPFFGAFASLVRSSPWLRPVTASRLAASQTPPAASRPPQNAPYSFSASYVQRLRSGRDGLRQFASTVQDEPALLGRMGADLLTAEGGAAAADESVGDAFIDAVTARVGDTFSQIRRVGADKITLTSLRGLFFVTVRNDSPYSVRVLIRLLAPRQLAFEDATKPIVIAAHSPQVTSFSVRAETTGRFPVQVQVLAPAGEAIAKSQMIVRSTAYNRVALVLTIGAALFLLFWWGRRFLPRPSS
jgi:hypothetical protein